VERSWLETIQSLGLDVQLGIVLLLFALDGLGTLVRRIAERRASKPRRVGRPRVAGRSSTATEADAWPPESLSATGRTAG
jgi:hypothetical protein